MKDLTILEDFLSWSVWGRGCLTSGCLWVQAGEVCGGGALSRVHVATLTQPLAVSGRSGLFATMSGIPPTAALFAPPLLRNWRPPLDKLEA